MTKRILFLVLLVLGLVGGLWLVRQSQELRRGATGGIVNLYLKPDGSVDLSGTKVGDKIKVMVLGKTNDLGIGGFSLRFRYDKSKLKLTNADDVGVHSNFAGFKMADIKNEEGLVDVISIALDEEINGLIVDVSNPLIWLNFEVTELGSARVYMDNSWSDMSVFGLDSQDDSYVIEAGVGNSLDVTYNVGGGGASPVPTTEPSLTPTDVPSSQSCRVDSDCGWCGDVCKKKVAGENCLTVLPPEGYECVCGSDDICVGRMVVLNTPTPTGVVGCTDSDGGKRYDVDGTTCVGNDCIMDYCDQNDGNKGVVEYFCDSDGQRANEYHLCDTDGGEICFANACRQCLTDGTSCGTGDPKTTSCYLCCDGAHQQVGVGMICGGGVNPSGTITPTPTLPANAKVVSFEIALSGVRDYSKCLGSNTVDVVMLKGNNRKEYKNVALVNTGKKTTKNETVLLVDKLNVTDFGETSGVAIFVKGQKHLQMKYGVNNQNKLYNKAGGELSFNNETVLNFANYPVLAGDVNRDGRVDGVDFVEIKKRATKFEEVAEGQSNSYDLDGSCVVNNGDVALMIQALNEKYDQMY